MKILINTENKSRKIIFPTFLITTKFAMKKLLSETNGIVTRTKVKEFRKAVRKARNTFPNLEIIHVEEADGTTVSIYL